MTQADILQGLTRFYDEAKHTPEAPMLDHLSNDLTRGSYVQKGQEMMAILGPGAAVLDWGTGFGQMAYVLAKLGANVTPFDVIRRNYTLLPAIPAPLTFGTETVALPFPDDSFDAVLSCGVLEHVPNILGSIQEVQRVLKPGGKFFVYNLPYILSPSEAYAARKKISQHPILFTKSGITQLMEVAGFEVAMIGHENGVPKRFSGPLKWLRPIADHAPWVFTWIDKIISRTPGVRSLLSNSIKLVAVKPYESSTNQQTRLATLWWD